MKTKPLEEQVKDILLKHTKTNYTMQLADIVEAISNLVEEEVRKALAKRGIEYWTVDEAEALQNLKELSNE